MDTGGRGLTFTTGTVTPLEMRDFLGRENREA